MEEHGERKLNNRGVELGRLHTQSEQRVKEGTSLVNKPSYYIIGNKSKDAVFCSISMLTNNYCLKHAMPHI